MRMSIKSLVWLLLLLNLYAYGQMGQYNYKQQLKGVDDQWHAVILPDEVFGKVSQDLSDIRIYGVTANNDTVEAPYVIQELKAEVKLKEIAFKLINTAHNANAYFFTLEIPTVESINQIKLDFKQQNFDWQITLEGSIKQEEWFTILENYRILSIDNELTKFKFTTLAFPNANYRFFRLRIDSKEKAELLAAKVGRKESTKGEYRTYTIEKSKIKEDKALKQTEIELDLEMPVSIGQLKIELADTFDYYRPITISYLSDSFKTKVGWRYNYKKLTTGTLNSIEENEFYFNSSILQRLKLIIHNSDNQPLKLGSIKVMGYKHKLAARFTAPATYFLTYGNANAVKPNYDIRQFENKIPEGITTLGFGKVETIEQADDLTRAPCLKTRIGFGALLHQ